MRFAAVATRSLLIGLFVAVPALAQPPSVPRFRDRSMDRASYVELAKEWKRYIEEHGETADALVNLGMAYDYSEEQEAALIAARRAAALEPDNPKALAFLGKMLIVWAGDEAQAIPLLEHCVEIAPGNEDGLTLLATAHMRLGDWEGSERAFKTIFDRGIIARPLQDYAYNMLVGLPPGAALITNGDNDTFPPLSLQAGMELRKDVVVVNRSLLNLPAYAKALFRDHPALAPDYDIDTHETREMPDGTITRLSDALLEKMIDKGKVPVYIAASVNTSSLGFDTELHVEGVNLRTTKAGLSAEESARLILDRYRLDSATDWSFPWSLYPGVSRMMTNYVAAIVRLVYYEGKLKEETRTRILDRAAAIADFHDMTGLSQTVDSLRKKK